MENEHKLSGKFPYPEFGVLNHCMINLTSRDENRDDVARLTPELVKLIPGYMENLLEMKRRFDESN